MTTIDKDFKVKNGIQVSEGGTFGGPVSVGAPTEPTHVVTKAFLESVLADFVPSRSVDAGNVDGDSFLDAGSPSTTEWDSVLDSGSI